jgi:hypothetical protein
MPVFPAHAQSVSILSVLNYLLSIPSIHIYQMLVLLVHPHLMFLFSVLFHLTLALLAFLWALFHLSAGVHLLASEQHLSWTYLPANSRFRTLDTDTITNLLYLYGLRLLTPLPASCLRSPGLKCRTPFRFIATLVPSRRDMGPTFHRGFTRVPFPLILTISLRPAGLDLRRSPVVCITTLSPMINNLNCSKDRLM